ncbi:DEAD/DEAH box helicase family protein [Candidatus Absconditicoccus praedator]|uniref:type I restriction endonuclease subunit R n=1 Tax=Candidatus Absconditicoccus praedator TaxID=2735562 RepID=UPI001E5219DB|nr:DEAD/DEAH box helicase family protein [Candidatus Absconditicoccus praedator]UFX83385.1 DEAD/DEAH box helicase family protein [Candidatus Absconditicoccus praedator]
MNEEQTKQNFIDTKLQQAGWDIRNKNQVYKEFPIHQNGTTYYADYALLDTDSKVLAIIEAKSDIRSSREGYYQALNYSAGIEQHQDFAPLVFFSNGKQIFYCNLKTPPRQIKTFFSKSDLKRITTLQKIQQPASNPKVDNNIAGRSYQIQAIKSITEGIDRGERKFLLTMATGTGKTRTAMGLIDVLLRSYHVQKVLFLCDRTALRDQAFKDGFKQYFPNEPKSLIVSDQTDENSRLFAATYQTMINYLDKFSSGFFDIIIVDEVHRSIFGQWKQILDHFDAYKVGLTATPVDYVERNTYEEFDRREQDPTFAYTLDDAINEGYLVPYKVLLARTKVQIQGIKGRQLPGHLKEQLQREGKTPEEYNFEGEDINKKINNKDTDRAIVREFMQNSIKAEDGLPGKTIIFAVNQLHAENLQQAFEEMYPQYRDFAVVITSNVERASEKYEDFKKSRTSKQNRVAISVDMLDTGVDVPDVVNLVFAKPVLSEAKFWQMVGRGTRLCPDLFGPGEDKEYFLIMDFGINFDEDHEFREPPKQPKSLQQKIFESKIDQMKLFENREDKQNYNKLKNQLLEMVNNLPVNDETVQYQEVLDEIESGRIFDNIAVNPYEKLQKVAPLMRYYGKHSVDELRFLEKTNRLKSQIIQGEVDDTTQDKIASDINALARNISNVEQKQDKLDKVLSPSYWEDMEFGQIEELEQDFTPLMKYKVKTSKDILVTDIQDDVIERRWIEYEEGKQMPSEKYWKEFEQTMEELTSSHPVVQKLLGGEELSDDEISMLEQELSSNEYRMNLDNLRKAYGRPTASFRQLVEVALGVGDMPDWEAEVDRLVEEFIKESNFDSRQIMFLRVLKSMLIQKKELNVPDDFYSPMVENSLGIDAFDKLFGDDEAEEIKEFLEKFRLG